MRMKLSEYLRINIVCYIKIISDVNKRKFDRMKIQFHLLQLQIFLSNNIKMRIIFVIFAQYKDDDTYMTPNKIITCFYFHSCAIFHSNI